MHRPCLLNSVSGLANALLNVYAVQVGHWSITAYVTGAVSTTTLLLSSLALVWQRRYVRRAKARYYGEVRRGFAEQQDSRDLGPLD